MFGFSAFYGEEEEEEEYEEELLYYEDLSPIERIIEFVLHSDVPVQRVSTLQTISQVAEEVGFNDTRDQLIPIMEQLVKDPEFTIRMVTGEQIIEIANLMEQYDENGLAVIQSKLVPFCIELAQDQQTEVRETAVFALISCVTRLQPEDMEELIIPVVVNFATSSADEDLRSLSVVIIDQLADHFTEPVMKAKCLPLVQELAEDPLFRVRKTVAASLCGIAKALDQSDAIESILPLFLALCQDEIWGVRKVTAENIVELAKCFPIETRISDFQSMYIRFLTDQSRWVKTSANEHLGQFIHLLADDKNNIQDSLITHFISMSSSSKSTSIASSSDSDDNVLCAFNFPAVLLTLGPEFWPRLRDAYTSLCTDMQWKVRRTLAFSIHEIAAILGEQITLNELVPAFDMFIRDLDEVRIGCVTHIADFIAKLPHEARSSLVPLIVSVETESEKDWRMRDIISSQLSEFCILFSNEDVEEHIIPMWKRMILDRVSQVREKACEATGTILTVSDRRNLLIQLTAFASSDTFRTRQMYIKCAQSFPTVLDTQLFKEMVIPVLQQLSEDRVVNIRLSLAQLLFAWTDTSVVISSLPEIQDLLAILETDSDSDVSFFALSATEAMEKALNPKIKLDGNKGGMLLTPLSLDKLHQKASPKKSPRPNDSPVSSPRNSNGPSTLNRSASGSSVGSTGSTGSTGSSGDLGEDLLDFAQSVDTDSDDDSESEADLTESEADLSDDDVLTPRSDRHKSVSSSDDEGN